ncbi:MAG: hypothetical protein ACD_79C01266G0001, partial [uncultured bacterium]
MYIYQRYTDSSYPIYPVITLNDIYENGSHGVYCYVTAQCIAVYNNIYNNNSYDFYNDSGYSVDARYSYWGEFTTSEINLKLSNNLTKLYDLQDNASKGSINYDGWTTSLIDTSKAISIRFLEPQQNVILPEGILTIKGIAYSYNGIKNIEASLDNGVTWQAVTFDTRFIEKSLWYFNTPSLIKGDYTVMFRLIDQNNNIQSYDEKLVFKIDSAQPALYGTLKKNETWNGTINLLGDVTVPPGLTLTILPGTRIVFPDRKDIIFGGNNNSKTELLIQGSIIAEGTSDNPVIFSSSLGSKATKGSWGGISGNGVFRFKNILMEYSDYGIRYTGNKSSDSFVFSNSIIQHNNATAISITAQNSANLQTIIENSVFNDNNSNGVYLYVKDSATILNSVVTNNTFSNCGERGIYLYTDSSSNGATVNNELTGNTIYGHSANGIYCNFYYNVKNQTNIINNTIYNSSTGIEGYYYNAASGSAITVRGNTLYSQTGGIKINDYYTSFNPQIINNIIRDHVSNGIECIYSNLNNGQSFIPYFEGNQIYNNSGNGLYLNASGQVTLLNNSIYKNLYNDLYNNSSATVLAQKNWWGLDTTNEINLGNNPKNLAKIYDYYDNASKGVTDYSNWLNIYTSPAIPTLNNVTTPAKQASQTISGTKESGTAILLNGIVIIPVNNDTTWSYTLNLNEGKNSIFLQTKNQAGMSSGIISSLIIKDTIAPKLFSSNPSINAKLAKSADKIEMTLVDDNSEIDLQATLNGANVKKNETENIPGSWTMNFNQIVFVPTTPLGEGNYTVSVNPADKPLGNVQNITISFIVDLIAPSIPVLDIINSPVKTNSYKISGTKEADTSVWLNNSEIISANSQTTWNFNLTLNEGKNDYILYVKDAAGNKSSDVSFSIVMDTAVPLLLSTTPQNNQFVSTLPQQVIWNFKNDGTVLNSQRILSSVLFKNSALQNIQGVWNITDFQIVFIPSGILLEDTYTASLTAYDLAGNQIAVSTKFTFDKTSPLTPALNPVSTPTNFVTQTLTGTKEALSSIWYNGYEVIPVNAQTSWSYNITFRQGDNNIEIYSKDYAGNKSGTVTSKIVYDETAPLPVSNLTANGAGKGTEVFLNWEGYPENLQGDVELYKIYYESLLFTQVEALQPKAIVQAGTFKHTVSNLIKGTKYYFAVVAVDTKNNALKSVTPVTAIPGDAIPPENVTNIAVQSFKNKLNFTWNHSFNSSEDLAGYRIYFDTQDRVEISKSQNSYEALSLNPATEYSFKITAYDNDNNESSGAQIKGSTLLPNPSNVVLEPKTGYINLSWNEVLPKSLVKSYVVYVKDSDFTSVSGMQPKITTNNTFASITGLTEGVTYYFAVTVINISNGEDKNVITSFGKTVPDTTGPEITNVKWNNTALTTGHVLLKPGTFYLNASDPIGISNVIFKIDNDNITNDSNGSNNYSSYFNITPYEDGIHKFTIVANDTLGNITTLEYDVNINLALPNVPTINSPENNKFTTTDNITVVGSAEKYSEVILYNNNVPVLPQLRLDSNNYFTKNIKLSEGENRIQASGVNRKGESQKSSEILIMLDTSKPSPPAQMQATPKAQGYIRLSWGNSIDGNLKGYNIYRSTSSFTDFNNAQKVNSGLVTGLYYDDLPSLEGTYYYRVKAIDMANNESDLSEEVFAASDNTMPQAVSIDYIPQGKFDVASGRISQGLVNVVIIVSENLQAIPFLSISPFGGSPLTVELTKKSNLEYTGFFLINPGTVSGTANAVFSARDIAGNRGTDIESGKTIQIDTLGPKVNIISINPATPVKNDSNNPVTIAVKISLTEKIKTGLIPELSYILSANGREKTLISDLTETEALDGEVQAFQGMFVLPSDAGLNETERLQFIYKGLDDLDNESTTILDANSFEIYQGNLPPLSSPLNFQGKSLPLGKIKLTWAEVDRAVDYQIYRKSSLEAELTPYIRTGKIFAYIDEPDSDGTYTYAIASIRHENNEEAISAKSNPIELLSDRVAPFAPSDLSLQLTGRGILASWDAPQFSETITYSLYRSNTAEILSVEGLSPLAEGITQLEVIDPTPSISDHAYVVTAKDGVGNESLSSNSCYLNFNLLPVSSINVKQTNYSAPVISWTHGSSNIAGYNFYLNTQGQEIKLNQALLTSQSYTDTGYAGNERTYSVSAMDQNSVESVKRSITLPKININLLNGTMLNNYRECLEDIIKDIPDFETILQNSPLPQKGLINRFNYLIKNETSEVVQNIQFKVKLGNYNHISGQFSINAGEYKIVPVIVGGYSDLLNISDIQNTVEIIPQTGEKVEIIRNSQIELEDNIYAATVQTEEFTRGISGFARFTFENTGTEEVELVTALNDGNSASNEISFNLLDEDGNILSGVPFKQSLGSALVNLSNHNTVARIAPGEIFTSELVEIPVPQNAPRNSTIQLKIKTIHYHVGKTDHVAIQGINSTKDITLADTSYYGEILNVTPSSALSGYNDSTVPEITINGKAVKWQDNTALSNAVLDLVISVKGFERKYNILTDVNGLFTHVFKPMPGEYGIYDVYAVHPELKDRKSQAQFIIKSVVISPLTYNINSSRNYEQTGNVVLRTSEGTEVNNAKLLYESSDQSGGAIPEGIHITLDPLAQTITSNSSKVFNFKIWADNNAKSSEKIFLTLQYEITENSQKTTKNQLIELNTQFSEAKPILYFTPNYIEAGVKQGSSVTETIELENKGFVEMTNVSVSLVNTDGTVAPSWIKLNTNAIVGSIPALNEPGVDKSLIQSKKQISFTISPNETITEGYHSFKLRLQSSNYPVTDINIFVNVINSAVTPVGNVLFKVSDIYTGTLNASNQIIQGLNGAAITLTHETIANTSRSLYTDSFGEALFENLPIGSYKVKINANNHDLYSGWIMVKMGITVNQDVFLTNNDDIIKVEFSVTPKTIEDKYEIVLNTTFKTDIPAAVVVSEPTSVNLPDMESGDVFNGEFEFVNHGLISATNLVLEVPQPDQFFKYEVLSAMPEKIIPNQRITIPYRVTCINPTNNTTGNFGNNTVMQAILLKYNYYCANGASNSGACKHYIIKTLPNYGQDDNNLTPPIESSNGGLGSLFGWWTGGSVSGGGVTYSKSLEGIYDFPLYDWLESFFRDYGDLFKRMLVAVGCYVDPLSRQFVDDEVDISVKVPNGVIEVKRRYYANNWHWDYLQKPLRIVRYVPPSDCMELGSMLAAGDTETINGGGCVRVPDNKFPYVIRKRGVNYYQRSETLFIHDIYSIVKSNDGYLWKAKNGDWERYDTGGWLLEYGNRLGVIGKIIYKEDTAYDPYFEKPYLYPDVEKGTTLSSLIKRVIGMEDKNGRQVLWFNYNADGLIASIKDNVNRTVNYTYFSPGATGVKKAAYPIGTSIINTAYIEDERFIERYRPLKAVSDILNDATTFEYTKGMLSKKTMATGYYTSVSYDLQNNVASVIDDKGIGQSFYYNYNKSKMEYYACITHSSGRKEEMWYDKCGDVVRSDLNGRNQFRLIKESKTSFIQFDEKGNQTRTETDEWKNVKRMVYPDGSETNIEYEYKYHQPVKVTDRKGIVSLFEYYTDGNLKKKTEAAGTSEQLVAEFTYNAQGQMETTTLGGNATSRMNYDSN